MFNEELRQRFRELLREDEVCSRQDIQALIIQYAQELYDQEFDGLGVSEITSQEIGAHLQECIVCCTYLNEADIEMRGRDA